VCLRVGRHDQTPRTGVERLSVDPGHHTAGRLTEGDAGSEVDTVTQVAIGYVSGSSAGGDPGQRQGGTAR
jgi:hypothetical protein